MNSPNTHLKFGLRMLAGLLPRAIAKSSLDFARQLAQRGLQASRYKGVRFGTRCIVDDACVFEDNVAIGPSSSLFGCKVGRQSYAAWGLWARDTEFGRYCAIGPNVIAGIGRHPSHTYVSSHPAFYSRAMPEGRSYAVKAFEEHRPVFVGSDVWVGANVFIGSGVTVGHGAIIGTGSVVTRDVSPYEVVAGSPAQTLRHRFQPDEIKFLLEQEWWAWSEVRLKAAGPHFSNYKSLKEWIARDSGESSSGN